MSTPSAQLDFPLLKLVSGARSTFGLRHQDYARYKSHCAAKVQHLRKSTGMTQTAGRSKKYQKRDLTPEKVSSDKHLQILLFDSERCWAQAQLLKAELGGPAASADVRHHFAKRLSKASSHAQHLVELVEHPSLSARLSAFQLGQVHAYHHVHAGALAFERGKHRHGLETLSIAYEILDKLAATAPTATDEALVSEMMDDVEPMLRFCAYKLGKDTSQGIEVIAKDVAKDLVPSAINGWNDLQARLEQEGAPEQREVIEVRWRGEIVPVRNVELVDVAGNVQKVLASLERDGSSSRKGGQGSVGKRKANGDREVFGAKRMGTYDKALLVLSEAEQVATQLVEDNRIALSKGHSARLEASARPLALFQSYVQYNLLAVRAKRDLLVIASAVAKLEAREAKALKTEESYIARTETRDSRVRQEKIQRLRTKAFPGNVKVYDTVLLSLEGMRDIEDVAQDDELATLVEARIDFVQAQRCSYVARAYALARQFPSALALNSRAKLYSRQSRSTASSLSPDLDFAPEEEGQGDQDHVFDSLPLDESSFDALDRQLEAEHDQIGRDWFDATGGKVEAGQQDAIPLAELSLSDKKSSQTSQQPKFYDIAYSYVVAFDMDAIAQKAGLRSEHVEQTDATDVVASVSDAAIEETEPQEQQSTPSKRGWGFGLFGRR
ncbi:uncharacterized protein JCM15063_000223 [Sporobolomyces koalae]|uniref:uncharacterized protein n=1 Tax=Sporobolomyces koalae TaxID=500713 RepID=UPI00317D9C94